MHNHTTNVAFQNNTHKFSLTLWILSCALLKHLLEYKNQNCFETSVHWMGFYTARGTCVRNLYVHFNWNKNARSERHQMVCYLNEQMEKSLSLPSHIHSDFLTTHVTRCHFKNWNVVKSQHRSLVSDCFCFCVWNSTTYSLNYPENKN